MTMLVELDPETEARVAAQAGRLGMAPERYIGEFLRENLPNHTAGKARFTREDLRTMTKRFQEGSEKMPILPPEATDRASFYEERR